MSYAFGIKMIKPYIRIGIVWGSFIATANLLNIRQSPTFIHNDMDIATVIHLLCGSIGKGTIYGLFYPLSMAGVGFDAVRGDREFKNHITLHSLYKSPITKYINILSDRKH